MPQLKFPDGFFWGSSTSAHQVEGGTTNDWSEWEKQNAERLAEGSEKRFGHLPHWNRIKEEAENPKNYISGGACDHYNRFREDFDIAKSLHHNAHRFSIEWSRIEPEEGCFDHAAIEHYRTVIQELRSRGMEPFVTLWHWTMPLWLVKKGGVSSREFPTHFENFVRTVVAHLKDDVTFWTTLNEPTSVIGNAYLSDIWPPQKKNFLSALRVFFILAKAHRRAFRTIHSLDSKAQVGFANVLHSYEAYHRHSPFDHFSIWIARFFTNRLMLLLTRDHHDYLTVQYYFHNRLRFPKKTHPVGLTQTDLGWEIYPKGIFNILDYLKRYKLPIYITENGLADATDEKREAFIREHLAWVHQAIEEGADVRGYFYWSLLDNFEWDKGFWPRFGLVEIDYATQKRTIRQSAYAYAKICETNTLETKS